MNILQEKVKKHLWPNRRKLEATIVVGSIGLLILYRFFDASSFITFGIQENILILSIFILLFLEGMATELSKATSQLRSEISVLSDQSRTSELKQVLSEYIEDQQPDEVKMIEYSGSTVDTIIHNAVLESAEVKLLLKYPHDTITDNHPDKILSNIKLLQSELGNAKNLQVRLYKAPAGLRARKFDDDLINCGWYTYQVSDNRGAHMKGHINPTILVTSDEQEEYRDLNQMFDRVFDSLWKSGETLEQLYNIDNPPNDEIADFQKWVNIKQCQHWIKSVSGTPQSSQLQRD